MRGLKQLLLAGALSASLLATPLVAQESQIPTPTPAEQLEIEQVMEEIFLYGKDFDSYLDISKLTENFSENQRIVLLSDISYFLYGSYSAPDYVCKHIATDVEQLAKKMGFKSCVATGKDDEAGHAYVLLKINDGLTIIDSWQIFTANTKNIEKILNLYQKEMGSLSFQHFFFEDEKLEYSFITKDGKRFIDFIGYNPSINPSLDGLTKSEESISPFAINLDTGNYSNSIDFNALGFFGKAGMINGDALSPMDKMGLFQLGYKNNFRIPEVIKIKPQLSVFYGAFSNDNSSYQDLAGINWDLVLATDNQERFNLTLRNAGNLSTELPTKYGSSLFYDFLIEAGASYKLPIKKTTLTPYAISQFKVLPTNFNSNPYNLMISEINLGALCDVSGDNGINLSINPHYSYRPYEQELGANINFGVEGLKANLGGYFSKSNYEFCPDTYGVDAGISISNKENLNISLNYKNDFVDYDGEIDSQPMLSLKGSIKF